jgi:kinesin family protein C1
VAQGALRAREAAEADARRENLALKAEVLAGKTALAAAQDESSELRRALAREREEGEIRARRGERLLREAKDDLEECEGKLAKVRKELEGAVSGEVGMQERCRVLEGRAERLAGEVAQLQAEKTAWAAERAEWDVEREAWEVEKRRGEEERRSLHGMVMELKGNIRVFCRVRPVLSDEEAGAEIAYPDAGLPYPSGQKEIVLSSTGAEREWDAGMGNKARREVWGFGFDRVGGVSSSSSSSLLLRR